MFTKISVERCWLASSAIRVVNLAPHFVRGHRPEFAPGHFHGEIQFAAIGNLHNRRLGAIRARQELTHQFDGISRGGKADPRRWLFREPFQPFQRQRQVRAALIVGNRVNLIHNHRLDRFQNFPALRGRKKDESDSGVVTRMCGGRASIARRSWASVSPVRTALRIGGIK